MKKIVASLLSLVIMCNMMVFASASSSETNKTVTTVTANGIEMIKTIQVINMGTEEEYSIITVCSGNEVAVRDTRYNYVLLNGEKINFTIGENVLSRATRPTTIDHDYIDRIANHWSYSYSTWVDYKFEKALNDLSMIALQTLLEAVGVVLDVIEALGGYFQRTEDAPLIDAFWVRTYFYGNTYVVSDFATIKQIYTETYEVLEGTCSATERLFH